MRHARDTAADHEVIYGAVAELWTRGVAIDWVALHGGPRRRVSLPTYPFERARHWIDAPLPPFASGRWPADGMEAPAGHHPTDDWCYEPAWEPLEATTPRRPCGERWLLLVDEPHAGHAAVARELTARGAEVRRVVAGDSFQVEHGCIRIRPGRRDDAEALLRHCASSGFVPTDVAHAWLMRPPPACGEPIDTIGDGYPRGFATLVALLQAQGAIGGAPWRLTVLTTGLPGASTDGWQVDAALLLGPVLAGPGEYPGLRARLIDGSADEQSAAALVDETLRERQAARVAVEGGVTRAPRLVRRRPMAPAPDTVAPLTSDAVCLITGGLGGLGSALATRLADTVRPCLVLVGRSPLPPREAWDGVLADAPGSVVASLVRRLRELESRGAKVTYYEADVADAAAVGRLVERVRVEVGRIDAIFHAAGVVDDGVIQMKTPDRAQRVVAVKAVGAAALDAATSTDPPGLFVLFSSTSAFLGLAGQADYTSANAYLDAFAHWRAATRPGRTLAVNWGMWKEVGLAARAAGIEAATGGPPAGATHPLLGHATTRSPQLVVFESSVRADDRWELDEHRLADGTAVLPGAAFIDLLWSAAVRTLDRTAIELAHVVFVAPLAAPNGGLQRIRTTLRCRGDSWDAVIESRGAGANGWRPHVRAEVLAGAKPWRDDAITSLAELWAGSSPSSDFDERGLNPRQAAHVRFGPRWHSVRRAARHEGSMVAELELTEALQGDLELPRIHPALFDMATTVALPLVEGGEGADGPFAPFSFGRVRLEGPLPSRLIVSSSVAAHVHQKADTATFDVRMFDAEGRLVARAEEFVMRRLARLQAAADFGADAEGPEAARLRRWVERGIGTKDGLDLLARLVEAPSPVQVVVSSIPPDELEREARPDAPRERSDSPVLAPTAPADIERVVAELWSELLGVERVDADDDFFELGGHSLIALRLASRLEKRLGARLTLSTLFEARTVRELSAALAAAVAPRWTALAPIQTTGGRRPFFCVHAVGGEVLAYRELARALGADQPFYGFRSRGHDGHRAPLATIEEQAALYVEELVAFDPQGPYCLGGYSHGARVAFEMAQQLRRAGRDVAFLAIIDTWPRQRFPREWRFLGAWLRNLPRWIRHELLASPAAHNLDRAARGWRRLARAVRSKASGRPHDPDVNDEMNVSHLPDHVRRTIRANFRAFVRYRPAGYDGDLVLLRAHAQPLASPASDDLDWRTFVSGRLRVRHVPGNHTSILRPPAVDVLARALREELDRALDERAAGGGQRPALAG
jgi:thioesterase domain-containing protein/NAD(P)-dependent dehydrogenase (short-subunit alcohol dehydrogenase family)/acyl carrier protein